MTRQIRHSALLGLLAITLVCMVAAPVVHAQTTGENTSQNTTLTEQLQNIFDTLQGLLTAVTSKQVGRVLGSSTSGSDLEQLLATRGYTLSDIPVIEVDEIQEASARTSGHTYYLDANSGSDTSGNGTQSSPYKTLKKVWPLLEGGDTVKLADGNYGSVEYCPWGCNDPNTALGAGPGDLFDDWVTIEAQSGARAEFERMSFYLRSTNSSKSRAYLKLKDLHIMDGIVVRDARDVQIIDSIIHTRTGWQTAGNSNLGRTAMNIRGTEDVLVKGNDIFQAPIGIALSFSDNVTIKDNHVHDLTHDGIRLVSSKNTLIDGNRIHSLDDGYSDAEALALRNAGVDATSMHVDSLHIFISGSPCNILVPVDTAVIRNNIFYDVEGQHVQMNDYYQCSGEQYWNKNLLFENNIFGPGGANPFNAADPADGLIFRHNTFLPMPGRTFTSPFRTLPMNRSTFRISDNYKRVAVYNNILSNALRLDDGHLINDWNVIWNTNNMPSLGPNSVIDTAINFSNLNAFDGKVKSGSTNIDIGTKLFSVVPLSPDRFGTARDNRPDAGVYEVPGRNPAVEDGLPDASSNPTIFVDDFEDGSHSASVYLNDTNQVGLSWTAPSSNNSGFWYESDGSNVRLSAPNPVGVDYILSNEGDDWKAYEFSFSGTNAFQIRGTGPLLLAQDEKNHYFIDIGRDAGKLYRVLNGVKTEFAASSALRLPHSGTKNYSFSVDVSDASIDFALDGGADGTIDLEFSDTNSIALDTFAAGGIGFVRDYDSSYIRTRFDDVRVEIEEFVGGSAPSQTANTSNSNSEPDTPILTPSSDASIYDTYDDTDDTSAQSTDVTNNTTQTNRGAGSSSRSTNSTNATAAEVTNTNNTGGGSSLSAPRFTRSLTLGDRGEDVRRLQQFLNRQGFIIKATRGGSPGNETTYFGENTRNALIRYQEARRTQILTPVGETRGTGYFGPSTIAQINRELTADTTPLPTTSVNTAPGLSNAQRTLILARIEALLAQIAVLQERLAQLRAGGQ